MHFLWEKFWSAPMFWNAFFEGADFEQVKNL